MFNDPRVGTMAAGGLAAAIVGLTASFLSHKYGYDVSVSEQGWAIVIVVGVIAPFVHRLRDDADLLRKLIFARLGESVPPSLVAPPLPEESQALLHRALVQSLAPTVPPPIETRPRSAAEMLGEIRK